MHSRDTKTERKKKHFGYIDTLTVRPRRQMGNASTAHRAEDRTANLQSPLRCEL